MRRSIDIIIAAITLMLLLLGCTMEATTEIYIRLPEGTPGPTWVQTLEPTIPMQTMEPTPTIAAEPTVPLSVEPETTEEVLAASRRDPTGPSSQQAYMVSKLSASDAYVSAGTINLREGPGLEHEVIAEYKRGTTLTITGESKEWFRVKVGSKTGFMIKEFVKRGIMPKQTPKPKNESESSGKFSEKEIYLVAQVAYLESKGGTAKGFRAVAGVILNRLGSRIFSPKTIEGIVFQKNQFTVADSESRLRAVVPTKTAINAVREVFNEGKNPFSPDVLFFRAKRFGTSWGSSKEYYKTIDGNSFFRYTR